MVGARRLEGGTGRHFRFVERALAFVIGLGLRSARLRSTQVARNRRSLAALDRRHAFAACDRIADLLVDPRDPSVRTGRQDGRSEEHTSELQSLMRISYAVFCLKKKIKYIQP